MTRPRSTTRTIALASILAAWPIPSAAERLPDSPTVDVQAMAAAQPAPWPGVAPLRRQSLLDRIAGRTAEPPATEGRPTPVQVGGGFAVGLNERGEVAGDHGAGELGYNVWIWRDGVTYVLSLSGDSWWVHDLNNRGQVVGEYDDHTVAPIRAFLWDNGTMRFLELEPPGGQAVAYAVNEGGEVAGEAVTADGLLGGACVWRNGVITWLGTSRGGNWVPRAINERGQVIGGVGPYGGGIPHAVLWDHGSVIDLAPGENPSEAIALNDRGQVIGWIADDASGAGHGFLWDRDHGLTDLGALRPAAINNRGQIVGNEQLANGDYHPFLWENGVATDLRPAGDTRQGVAEDINERGQVVLGLFTPGEPGVVAVWERGAVIEVGTGSGPYAINEHGQVLISNWNDPLLWERGTITYLFHAPPGPSSLDADVEMLPRKGSPPALSQAGGIAAESDGVRASVATPGTSPGSGGVLELSLRSEPAAGGSTTLRYTVPRPERVTIEIFDVRGARVRSLVNEWQPIGSRSVTWDGADVTGRRVPPGLYLTRLRAGAESRMVKVIRGR